VARTLEVNASMGISGVEETVTVTGDAPVVDVRSATVQTNIERELLEAVPTGRNPWVMAGLVPGMVTTRVDVGGSNGMQQYGMEIFGSSATMQSFQVDGLKVNWPGGTGGWTMQYYGFSMYEEFNFQTSQHTAESDTGGVLMNMVVKTGGNEFSGDAIGLWNAVDLQGEPAEAGGAPSPSRLTSTAPSAGRSSGTRRGSSPPTATGSTSRKSVFPTTSWARRQSTTTGSATSVASSLCRPRTTTGSR